MASIERHKLEVVRGLDGISWTPTTLRQVRNVLVGTVAQGVWAALRFVLSSSLIV
ncbi:MAG: hypothetical protein QOE89_2054, partial [Pseudonocardiales bacterium]|nr:hypothetical protein [Pseudonocardiales bacterium]